MQGRRIVESTGLIEWYINNSYLIAGKWGICYVLGLRKEVVSGNIQSTDNIDVPKILFFWWTPLVAAATENYSANEGKFNGTED